MQKAAECWERGRLVRILARRGSPEITISFPASRSVRTGRSRSWHSGPTSRQSPLSALLKLGVHPPNNFNVETLPLISDFLNLIVDVRHLNVECLRLIVQIPALTLQPQSLNAEKRHLNAETFNLNVDSLHLNVEVQNLNRENVCSA